MPESTSSNDRSVRQARFVEQDEVIDVSQTDAVNIDEAPASIWKDAWVSLRKRPIFIVSALIILAVIVVAAFPSLFTSADPRYCNLDFSMQGPQSGHIFGFDRQGCDIYARTIYGARASVLTGVGVTFLVLVIGVLFGAFAGFYGGWADSLLSRLTDIFFGVPLILAAIVLMQLFTDRTIWTVILVLALFGWPQMARITRGAVLSAKNNDYVMASRALGVSKVRTLIRHVLPNSMAPIIVITTISLGTFIVAEATLSFLGIGLPPTEVSWGGDISAAQVTLRQGSTILFYPAAALAITVLGFIMMGDALRDALDPKARKR
ncbi:MULTISPECIES: ABC transporter permease [Nocardiaceae]|jgi:oligopeptide transport system permease protein|uniref:ABC transporter permease n=1 Tax=Nocardiaceae TaxID=85025 RepID=UPI000371E603|nr:MULTISPECIES: ABC transporter permease [Rhodococcus]OZC46808.1 ABC transporter permease [Rhodococcus sp. 06-621-2]OZC52957.1 ABC transporter permease [Rhodococcus sp. RS1C4]OZC77493.1 ABC transporter permease [Rhodococcus sp. 06-418-1B]OZC77695.1 ABC transporter permease [Rhodococcus sp. 06-418-1B]OZD14916.1 ABC transporter permease [Rhodococcus sp. 06-156-4C]